MNTEDLHLKKKWDDIQKKDGIFSQFKDVYYDDYQNLRKWLEIYFKDLDMEQKCEIINLAGENVVANLEGIVDEKEILALKVYSYALRKNFVEVWEMVGKLRNHYEEEIQSIKVNYDGQLSWLQEQVESLKADVMELRFAK